MFEISIEDNFSAAHNLRNYKGKCEHLHGHNYKVRVFVCGKVLDKTGMLLDFTILKEILKEITNEFDHKYLNEEKPFDKINPTAENIAKYIYRRIKLKVKSKKLKVIEVDVWETEKNFAKYYEE
ncbi:MAG: 6-carboxytetrahydropterin synthase QueD [Elusimicrobia bacterium RIFOXYD2_FULL_34_15]|nr:MAG: 6-carboxytetrahydropterin synthase QueD [Elusimicrobia bacterium RIFOXYD2_FULL_34_15]